MSLAANLHDSLFAAIEQRFATDADLIAICGKLYVDFVPDKDENGVEPGYPLVFVTQGEEGGTTDISTVGPVAESFAIMFNVAASTRSLAAQIAWQIAKLFGGDASEREWRGEYDGVEIIGCIRDRPPVVVQVGQGECEATVGVVVIAAPVES